MYTSMVLFALSGLVTSVEAARVPAWDTDYAAACRQVARVKKPLVVVLGAGEDGWKKLGKEGELPSEAHRILASDYVCVHIDTATENGKRLANRFGMTSGLGIIISDRTGDLQAFRHEGDLADDALVSYLKRFSDPNLVVRTTVTNPQENVAARPSVPSGYIPVYSDRSFSSSSICVGGR
jgi:hypothetical protein